MCESQGQVLEGSVIRQLAAETGYAGASSFAATFLCMLPGRVARILMALGEGDAEFALDAVLSLKISSSMAGAVEMEHVCCELESRLRDGKQPSGALLCSPLRRLEEALTDLLVAWPALVS